MYGYRIKKVLNKITFLSIGPYIVIVPHIVLLLPDAVLYNRVLLTHCYRYDDLTRYCSCMR